MGRFVINVSIALIIAICFSILVGAREISSLAIRSEPGGADVYIDNIYKGFTPLNIADIPAGNHIIKITKNGYYEWENTTEVSNASMEISAFLEIMRGTLDINIEAGIGEVYIDNIYEGFVGKDRPLSVTLLYGSHNINITRDGCNYWNKTLQINETITRLDSSFRCRESPDRKGAETKFAFDGPSSSQIAGSPLNVDVIVKNTGSSTNNFRVVLSVRDPYGNWTVLPYQSKTARDIEHAYFIYDIPPSGPPGTWIVRATVWGGVSDGGNYKQSLFSNVILIKWNRIVEGGGLKTRYDYKEKPFNVSVPVQNTSAETTPLPEVVATPTGNIIYTKVITSKFGQPDLKINAGDEVVWLTEAPFGYKIVEIDKKIGDINVLKDWKARFVFNKSGNYRFRLFINHSYTYEATPSIQNIKVLPPIVPAILPSITSTISPSVTSTLSITETPASIPSTPTFTPKSTLIPAPRSFGFEAIIAGIGMLLAFAYRRR